MRKLICDGFSRGYKERIYMEKVSEDVYGLYKAYIYEEKVCAYFVRLYSNTNRVCADFVVLYKG